MENVPHIIVDGYNAIHAHAGLRKLLLEKSQEAARAGLREMLAPVHDFGTGLLTIVYDGSGAEISMERDAARKTFSEVFTPSSMTADELIESLCAVSKNPSSITVITRDNLLRLTASSFGAMSIAPDRFFETARESARRISGVARENNFHVSREWKKCNPFFELDSLAADISSAMRNSPLLSKHMKKKLARGAAESGKSETSSVRIDELTGKGDAVRGHEDFEHSVSSSFKSLLSRQKVSQELKFGRMKLFGGKPSAKALGELARAFGKGESSADSKKFPSAKKGAGSSRRRKS